MNKPTKYPWIPVATRNPRSDGEYVATVKLDCVFGKKVYVDIVKYEVAYGWHLMTNDYRVIAWHKKPEPYKEATHDQSGL